MGDCVRKFLICNKYSEEELDEVELKSFILVHKSDNEYSGVLETIEYGEEYSYTVSVIYDGEYFSWEILY